MATLASMTSATHKKEKRHWHPKNGSR